MRGCPICRQQAAVIGDQRVVFQPFPARWGQGKIPGGEGPGGACGTNRLNGVLPARPSRTPMRRISAQFAARDDVLPQVTGKVAQPCACCTVDKPADDLPEAFVAKLLQLALGALSGNIPAIFPRSGEGCIDRGHDGFPVQNLLFLRMRQAFEPPPCGQQALADDLLGRSGTGGHAKTGVLPATHARGPAGQAFCKGGMVFVIQQAAVSELHPESNPINPGRGLAADMGNMAGTVNVLTGRDLEQGPVFGTPRPCAKAEIAAFDEAPMNLRQPGPVPARFLEETGCGGSSTVRRIKSRHARCPSGLTSPRTGPGSGGRASSRPSRSRPWGPGRWRRGAGPRPRCRYAPRGCPCG